MYTIVGGDQKEYGPVEADVLRQWIAQGRANRATRVRIDSDPNWKVLGELPEFGEALGAQDKPPAVADLTVPPPASSLPTVEDFR
ncbi:MAG: GYF domain-containing protein, partial [Verrucomicrobiota bacterium]